MEIPRKPVSRLPIIAGSYYKISLKRREGEKGKGGEKSNLSIIALQLNLLDAGHLEFLGYIYIYTYIEFASLDTSRILASSARIRCYADDRYGAPGTATLNRTVPSFSGPRASGAECRVPAPPPQRDVFSCTKPQ